MDNIGVSVSQCVFVCVCVYEIGFFGDTVNKYVGCALFGNMIYVYYTYSTSRVLFQSICRHSYQLQAGCGSLYLPTEQCVKYYDSLWPSL